MKTKALKALLLSFLLSNSTLLWAQNSEIGLSVTLSGHFLFGPYYRYWFDDNNEVDIMIPAAWEGKGPVRFPAGIQTGYHYYFGDNNWRFSAGAEYSMYFGPKTDGKRQNLHLFSIVPGVQYRWDDTKMSIEELVWISYFKLNGKQKILPTGLETKFGVKL